MAKSSLNIAIGFLLLMAVFCSGGLEAGNWVSLANMHTARSEIYCANLKNKIYTAGGIGFFRTLNSCEVYDAEQNTWSFCPSLPYPIHHLAMASDGEEVYASGGFVTLFFRHDNDAALWSLSPDASEWQRIDDLPSPLGEHVMIAVGQTLYLIGGRSPQGVSNELWAFDLESKEWRTLRNMPTARHSAAAVAVGQQIWVLGGRSDALGSRISNVEIYDIPTNQWHVGPALPVGRGGHSAVLLDHQIHVFGGEQFDPDRVLSRHDVLDVASKRWQTGELLMTPRHGTAACTMGDQQAIVLGGATQAGTRTIYSVSKVVEGFE